MNEMNETLSKLNTVKAVERNWQNRIENTQQCYIEVAFKLQISFQSTLRAANV